MEYQYTWKIQRSLAHEWLVPVYRLYINNAPTGFVLTLECIQDWSLGSHLGIDLEKELISIISQDAKLPIYEAHKALLALRDR